MLTGFLVATAAVIVVTAPNAWSWAKSQKWAPEWMKRNRKGGG